MSIGKHESPRAITTTWLTPPHVLAELGPFDFDPCAAPEPRPWSTARRMNSEADGLALPWQGRVWLNPPYTSADLGKWLARMADHDHGTALIFARTETRAFHAYVWQRASALLFLAGRLRFYDAAGVPGAGNAGAPSVLCAYGEADASRLATCAIPGAFVRLEDFK